jgi:eukaryotic-like serine/threonine-protein kinase
VFGTPEYMSPEQARGEEAGPQSDLYALGVLFFEMLTGQLPFRSSDRETLLEMQRTAQAPRPTSIKPDVLPAAEGMVLRLLEKERRKRYQDAHHLHEELKALQRALPSSPWEVGSNIDNAPPPPPPPPESPGVIEWAHRAGLFSRMVSRAYATGNAPAEIQAAVAQAWDLAAKATRLEGEVASHTRKLESLERRGRALRAEIGRKVEELAYEESRILRDSSAAQQDAARLREQVAIAERAAVGAKQQSDQVVVQSGLSAAQLRQVFERSGAALATVEAKRGQLGEREHAAMAKENQAKDLRKQIEELRAQLARYAEALEEDLNAGRQKVTTRTRDGVAFEKAFGDLSALLIGHLKGKPEVRDLMEELLSGMHAPQQRLPDAPQSAGSLRAAVKV